MSILVTWFDMSLLKLDLDAVTVQSQKNAQAMTKGGSADGALRLLSTMRTEALFTVHRDSTDSLKKSGQISIDLPFFYRLLFFGWDLVFLKCIFQPSRSLAHHCSLRDLWRTWTLTTCTMEKKAHWMAFLSWFFFHIPPTLWELFNVEAIELDTVVCNSCLGACANAARWQEALDLVPFSSGRSGREPQQHKSCHIAPTKLRLMTDHKLNKTTATCFSDCS